MENDKSKVYIKVDENSRILRCEGGYAMGNIENIDEWIFIDEGTGDRYNLCQSHYFDGSLFTIQGIPRYKWDGNAAILRTVEEIEADRAELPKPVPAIEERLTEMEQQLIESDEVVVELYEKQLEQEFINIAQDEALCELYEIMEV
ncbi:MAG: hypothetical protein ACI4TP_02105 [Anaerotignum sp.]